MLQFLWNARYVDEKPWAKPGSQFETSKSCLQKHFAGTYCVITVLNFVFRIARLDSNGQCVIGMERRALLPLIVFDLVVNVSETPPHIY